MDDDWEMDDWEEEAFDEDVYDHSELDTTTEVELAAYDDAEEEAFDEPWSASAIEDDDEAGDVDDGGAATVEPAGTDTGGGRMGWNAWDVGTVFALGGWLADHHVENTARQVAAALAENNSGRGHGGRPLGAAHPPPPSRHLYGTATGTLAVGDNLEAGALFGELAAASNAGRDLMFQAEGPGGTNGPLLLYLSAVPLSSGPRLWVVAEEHVGGFKAMRLIPVFEPVRSTGAAAFATDHASEAVDAAIWACQREGVDLEELTVTERR